MTIQFDPNNQKPPVTPPFATYIPTRNPYWKTHKNIGLAHNAMSNKYPYGESILYHYNYDTNLWEEIDRYEKPELCWHCKTEGAFAQTHYNSEKKEFITTFETKEEYNNRYSNNVYISNYSPIRCGLTSGYGKNKNFTPEYKAPVVCEKCYELHWNYYAKDKLDFPTQN